MRTYEKYKDSGISWIGKVPENWVKCRFKNIMNLITDASTSDNKIGLENIESGTGKYIQTDSKFEGNGVAFKPHDIVYGKLRPYLQKVWCADSEGNAVGDFFVFRNKCNSSSFFLKYVLLSDNFTQFANGTTYGAKMPRVSSNAILDQETYIPPLSEQEAIANYLDKKTAEIDKIIAEREKKIELLNELKSSIISRAVTKGINPHAKMKDSGIDWIGDIPEGWEICNLKRIADIYGRIGFRGYTEADIVQEGEGAITLSPSNMQNGGMDYSKLKYLSWTKYYESPEIMIQNGDVLMVKTGSSYGKCAFVSNLPFKATINPQIIVLKNLKIDGELLSWILQTPYVQFQILNTVIGSTIPTIAQEKIKNYSLVLPPQIVITPILEFIKKRVEKIENSKKQIFSEISLLREYKQSLISEVVTGKRKVIV